MVRVWALDNEFTYSVLRTHLFNVIVWVRLWCDISDFGHSGFCVGLCVDRCISVYVGVHGSLVLCVCACWYGACVFVCV